MGFLIALPFFSTGQEQKDRPTTFEDDLQLKWKTTKDSIQLMAINKLLAPIEMVVSDRTTNEEIQSFLLPAKDSIVLHAAQGIELDTLVKKVKKEWKFSYYIGHPKTISIDSNYLYRLPFKAHKKYEVSQGWNGKYSHKGTLSGYALDFQLNIGEPVHAARDGIVIKAIDWFTKQGGPELRNMANRIVVLHQDGTLASYVHLQYKGVLVNVGDSIKAGQKIGVSGLTGHTRGPHLHFVVRKERDISIPIYFKGYETIALKRGHRYKVK